MAIFIYLKIPWELFDIYKSIPSLVHVPSGKYRVERVSNPYDESGQTWLILAGTTIGASEPFLRSLSEIAFGDLSVIVRDEPIDNPAELTYTPTDPEIPSP